MSKKAGRSVAVTGATGFVGRHAVAALAAAGWQVRVLARNEPATGFWDGTAPDIVRGSLDDGDALAQLVRGADAVLHLAGAIKARSDADFMRVNRDGTRAVAAAMLKAAPKAHLLHVSSLAAREPQLSGYCASKRAGEEAVIDLLGPERVSIIRPPAVYGPGDRETLVFFQLARQRWVPLPGPDTARLAVIHVQDLARELAAQLDRVPSRIVQGVADEQPEGYRWRDILGAAAAAVGNTAPRFVQLPGGVVRGVGGSAGLAASLAAKLTGQAAMFTPGKLRELLHEDWSVPRSSLLVSTAPQTPLSQGFKATAAWYLREGWLRPM